MPVPMSCPRCEADLRGKPIPQGDGASCGGEAFSSREQFAAALAIEPGHNFVYEYVGIEEPARGYDRIALYRLGRK